MEAMKRKLEGKTAVITGASRGIGKEVCRLFAESGANLIACTRKRDPAVQNELERMAEESGVHVYSVCFDLSDKESVKAGIKEIKSLKIPIDILVNNAGIGHLALLPMVTTEDMQRVFQVNYFAQVQLVQGLCRSISKTRGCIVNVASVAGLDGDVGNTVYGASKASMVLFTKVLSRELAKDGVRVNAIAPGLTETEFAVAMGERARESMIASSQMHRLGKPFEIARTILFLASEEASFITGQVIRVDGGMKI